RALAGDGPTGSHLEPTAAGEPVCSVYAARHLAHGVQPGKRCRGVPVDPYAAHQVVLGRHDLEDGDRERVTAGVERLRQVRVLGDDAVGYVAKVELHGALRGAPP